MRPKIDTAICAENQLLHMSGRIIWKLLAVDEPIAVEAAQRKHASWQSSSGESRKGVTGKAGVDVVTNQRSGSCIGVDRQHRAVGLCIGKNRCLGGRCCCRSQ